MCDLRYKQHSCWMVWKVYAWDHHTLLWRHMQECWLSLFSRRLICLCLLTNVLAGRDGVFMCVCVGVFVPYYLFLACLTDNKSNIPEGLWHNIWYQWHYSHACASYFWVSVQSTQLRTSANWGLNSWKNNLFFFLQSNSYLFWNVFRDQKLDYIIKCSCLNIATRNSIRFTIESKPFHFRFVIFGTVQYTGVHVCALMERQTKNTP